MTCEDALEFTRKMYTELLEAHGNYAIHVWNVIRLWRIFAVFAIILLTIYAGIIVWFVSKGALELL